MPPASTRWVVEADLYESLPQCQTQGLGFVVRAVQDRALVAGVDKAPAGRLFDVARAASSQGTLALALRGRPGQPAWGVVLRLS